MLENVRVCYLVNCMGQAVRSFGPSVKKTAFAKLQPSCQCFVMVSPGRSETDSGRNICSSSNEIRQIINFLPIYLPVYLSTYVCPLIFVAAR